MKKIGFILILAVLGFSTTKAQDIEVKALPVNTKLSNELSPFYIDSTLYFTSNRKSSVVTSVLDQNSELLYKVYQCQLLKNGKWSAPKLAVEAVQSDVNNGSIGFSADGTKLFLTRSQWPNIKSAKRNKTGGKFGLYSAQMQPSGWSSPQSLPFNSIDLYSCGQPSLSADGKFLFFSSDMEKGYGKADIYFCEKTDSSWSEPINVSALINTTGNDLFPFIHPSGKLFFASDGHGGLGGLDIFYSSKENGQWSEPQSLGEPINTIFDDYGCFVLADEESGYFSSNRENNDNIYSYKQLFPTFENPAPQKIDSYCYTFFESGAYQSDTMPFIYRWTFSEGVHAKGLKVRHCFPGPGSYNVSLNVVDTLANVDLMTVAQHQVNLVKTEQVFITCADTVKLGTVIDLSADQSYFESIEPKEYYWDLGDGEKKKGVTINHIFRTKGINTISCGTIDKLDSSYKFCSTKEIYVIE